MLTWSDGSQKDDEEVELSVVCFEVLGNWTREARSWRVIVAREVCCGTTDWAVLFCLFPNGWRGGEMSWICLSRSLCFATEIDLQKQEPLGVFEY